MQLITNEQSLVSATCKGHEVQVYDNGFGKLFMFINTWGVLGVVRAISWEDAYSIICDEFQPEASENLAQIIEEYGEDFHDNAIFQENYGFRNSGPNIRDVLGHGIYERDINGEMLEELTAERMERYQLKLTFSLPEENNLK